MTSVPIWDLVFQLPRAEFAAVADDAPSHGRVPWLNFFGEPQSCEAVFGPSDRRDNLLKPTDIEH